MLQDIDRDLIAAAWRNDVVAATRLVAEGADVNAQDDSQQSAYLIATSEGYHELLLLTLAHGADIAAKDSYNGTGLIRAADRGHARIIGTLLQAGLEIDHINNLGWTALHEAIILGDGGEAHTDCVRLLLARGADPALLSEQDGIAPIAHATNRGFERIAGVLRLVIDTPPPADPLSALDSAIAADDADMATVAIRHGAVPRPLENGAGNVGRLLRYLTTQD